MRGRTLTLGVKFLDVALGGILPHDVVLIGAKTGAGKTALASLIAVTNALVGKRVHYFALEAEEAEIERRMKFSMLGKLLYDRVARNVRRVNFLDWYAGKVDDITAPYEAEVDEKLATAMKTLRTFYRKRDFFAEDFQRMTQEIQAETDLVILDHLHYVDSREPNENVGYKAIVKRIRDVALDIGKPVVVVAHLRKSDRRSSRLIPEVEDFHGTSDVPKMATKAIIIAPAYDQESSDPCLWPTYLAPVKCRFDSSRARYVGLSTYDVRTGRYDESFTLGRLTPSGDRFESVPHNQQPEWAR